MMLLAEKTVKIGYFVLSFVRQMFVIGLIVSINLFVDCPSRLVILCRLEIIDYAHRPFVQSQIKLINPGSMLV